ncbi:L,D-transpeptidase family protein [Streptomyces sp. LP05-1]|uniref:L,D-transpeptidase family protein n=1 Tax=Streptomyces pyxinae TaxID=2970734 RepID=A0ABT2CJU3_9ACTN|nr:L,D-transpeptidase family protein [Streptomyces sp. LP05-1]MCS0637694.1 L,D-transpeptidase family protein [Streptomyces sp. LP05-1]
MRRTSVLKAAVPVAAAVALAAGCAPGTVRAGAPSARALPAPASAPPAPSAPAAPSPSATAAPAFVPVPAPATSWSPPPAPSAPAKASATPSDRSRPSPEPRPAALMAEGSESERVRELQARLRQLGHFHRNPTAFYGSLTAEAVSGFQRARGLDATGEVDRETWRRLVTASRVPTADELRPPTTNELDRPDARCLTGRVLCVSKESRTLAWMIGGRVVSAMDVRFGTENTPTREGVFTVDRKEREWTSTLYHTPMPYAMFFSGGQAVHYSADFAARGYSGGSHGCVNVRDKERLAAVFAQVRPGDKVVVHW